MSLSDKVKAICPTGKDGCLSRKCIVKAVIIAEIIGAYLGFTAPMLSVFGRILAAISGATIVLAFVTIALIFYSRLKAICPENEK